MNGAVALIGLIILGACIAVAWVVAARTMAGKDFFKELQKSYAEEEITRADYKRISELFIYTDGFSHTHEAYLRDLLKKAKEKKNGIKAD